MLGDLALLGYRFLGGLFGGDNFAEFGHGGERGALAVRGGQDKSRGTDPPPPLNGASYPGIDSDANRG